MAAPKNIQRAGYGFTLNEAQCNLLAHEAHVVRLER